LEPDWRGIHSRPFHHDCPSGENCPCPIRALLCQANRTTTAEYPNQVRNRPSPLLERPKEEELPKLLRKLRVSFMQVLTEGSVTEKRESLGNHAFAAQFSQHAHGMTIVARRKPTPCGLSATAIARSSLGQRGFRRHQKYSPLRFHGCTLAKVVTTASRAPPPSLVGTRQGDRELASCRLIDTATSTFRIASFSCPS
jgi:hypothetical protein